MSEPTYKPWLHRFAVLTAVATLALIGLGGLVTSHDAGMSVPDWPTSYGYNMFLLPISKWVGGIFYEHTHRLLATIVGTLVVILTRWLGGKQACKPLMAIGLLEILAGIALIFLAPNLKATGHFLSGIGGVVLLAGLVFVSNAPAPKTVVQLGWTVFFLVQFQGLLGGLRVVLFKDQIGIFHAALAQIFFVLLCTIALLTSRWWTVCNQRLTPPRPLGGEGQGEGEILRPSPDAFLIRRLLLATTLIIFLQLILGATMRHQHAGLSIPDFPLAYHHVWPPMDAASVQSYNAHRVDVTENNPITAFQILLQMLHRMMALAIFCLVTASAWLTRRHLGSRHPLAKLSLTWFGLICLQVILGAVTIWSNKAADIATTHVVVGALSLMTGALLTIISFRVLMGVRVAADEITRDSATSPPLSAKPAAWKS